jgi:flagellar motor switch protein FliG
MSKITYRRGSPNKLGKPPIKEEMRAFDRLPKSVREALRNSIFNFNALYMQDELRKHSAKEVVAFIKNQNARIAEQLKQESPFQ